MKKNKANLDKLIKHRKKIDPPGLQYFLEVVIPEYYPRMKTISMIEIADRVFSEFVRLTNANEKGDCQCVTCKLWFYWKDIQNGHYKKRSWYKYRFNLMNCHPQCYRCNVALEGDYRNYHIYMVDTYGADTEDRIWNDQETVKLYDYDLIMQCVNRHQEIVKIREKLPDNS